MNRDEYINRVISLVNSRADKREIRRELEAHIDDRIEYFTESGYDRESATQRAVEKMGSPTDVAVSMEKLHNHTHWVIMSVAFTFVYIIGLVFADVRFYDFGIINLVDFEEVSRVGSIVSVLIFLCGALAFLSSFKSKSTVLLWIFGIVSIATPVVSCYALIPFAYQLVSIFTDFPAAVICNEPFFNIGEVFWHIDDLFVNGMPTFIFYSLVILCILISLLCVVSGIVSLAYARELSSDFSSKGFEKRVKKYALLLIIISVVALTGTACEEIYDSVYYYKENKAFTNNLSSNFENAKAEYDSITLPMTSQQVLELAEEKNLTDYDIDEMKYGMLAFYQNEAFTVQLNDDDDDGIYENKRMFSTNFVNLSDEQTEKIYSLNKGSSIEELEEIVGSENITDYRETVEGDITKTAVNIYTFNGKDYWFYYENGVLTETDFYTGEE
ncbi:MAG: permease prefix domain 1-containing protein [Eubacterium sp.]